MTSPTSLKLRPADQQDTSVLLNFINSQAYVHRHLDWREPVAWLGHQPFWIIQDEQDIIAALACPPDPAEVAWVRLFAVDSFFSPDYAWKLLFEKVQSHLPVNPNPVIASLALREWFANLLVRNGFSHYQDIVVLVFRERELPESRTNPDVLIRPMLPTDLPIVEKIDHSAFESIWQLSLADLTSAFERGYYSTIAEIDGQVVGYLMSSLNGYFAHLSRLAVIPGFQGKSIGYSMVYQMLSFFLNNTDVWEITVNTQNTNTLSLSLYKRAGFRLSGETFPVLVFDQ